MKPILFALCLFTLLSCGDDDTPVMEEEMTCPTEITPTFSVTVVNEADGALLDEVSITAMDQMFSTELTEVSTGVYEGPDERPGSYTLRIEKDGFQTVITGLITPGEDICGLVTEVLTFELQEM